MCRNLPHTISYNSKIAAYTSETIQFSWAANSFSSRHFLSTTKSAASLSPFGWLATSRIVSVLSLANSRQVRSVFSTSNDLLQHIQASGDRSHIHGYLIHTCRFASSPTTDKFWQVQSSLISQLRIIRLLSMVVTIIIPDHGGASVKSFIKSLSTLH
jgi:hypothetical protein